MSNITRKLLTGLCTSSSSPKFYRYKLNLQGHSGSFLCQNKWDRVCREFHSCLWVSKTGCSGEWGQLRLHPVVFSVSEVPFSGGQTCPRWMWFGGFRNGGSENSSPAARNKPQKHEGRQQTHFNPKRNCWISFKPVLLVWRWPKPHTLGCHCGSELSARWLQVRKTRSSHSLPSVTTVISHLHNKKVHRTISSRKQVSRHPVL